MGEAPDTYAAWKDSPLDFSIDNGFRPIVELWARARVAWETMRCDGAAEVDGLTLVVSHNACGQALICTALGLDETHFRSFDFPNCGAAEVAFEAGGGKGEQARWRWRLPAEAGDGQWRTGPVEQQLLDKGSVSGY